MRIKEKSTQRMCCYNLGLPEFKLIKHNLVKEHRLSLLLYTLLFMNIQVLLASSQGTKKLISPLFVVSTSATKHGIFYDTELSWTSY